MLPLLLFGSGCASPKNAAETSPVQKPLSFPIEVDSAVIQILGDSLSTRLFAAENVEAYRLVFSDSLRQAGSKFPYLRSNGPGQLTDKQKKRIYSDFLDREENYHSDSIIVMSPYIPELELVFTTDSVETSVVISFSDHSWGITSQGKQLFNYNYTNEKPLSEVMTSLGKSTR